MKSSKNVITSRSISFFQTIFKLVEDTIKRYFTASNTRKIAWAIIAFGIILRLSQYLFNRSLWIDEAQLALNITNKNYLDFLRPLSYHQAAPLGFLVIEKFVVQLLGNTDLVLRLFPFCSGILSLFLFYKVAAYNLGNRATLISLGLFSISNPLIYYSSELKQYSSDVTILLLLLLVLYLAVKKKSNFHFVLLGLAGAILLWFSHPVMFTLTGIGISLGIYYLVRKDKTSFVRLLFVVAFWLISFSIFFLVTLRYLVNDNYMVNFWSGGFVPRNPFSTAINFWDWYLNHTFEIFQFPVGIYFSGLAALTFIIGGIMFLKFKKFKLAILLFPVFATIIASVFRKYPFTDRLILFLVPIILIIIGEGVSSLFTRKLTRSNILGILVLILLYLHPFANDLRKLVIPRTRDEAKPVMQFLEQNRKKGDTIFLYKLSEFAFKYYAPKYGFSQNDYIVGKAFRGKLEDMSRFLGKKRFWIVFTHISPFYNYGKIMYLSYLKDHGKELKSFSAPGASVYLFELNIKK